MRMHEKGVKAGRDRRHVLVEYDKLVKFFKLKPLEPTKLAAMTANQLYQLCEDTWNRQPNRRKLDYQEAMSLSPRRKPTAFKWFVVDTMNIKQPKDLAERLIIYVQLPFRYPGFVRRKKARMKAEKAEAKAWQESDCYMCALRLKKNCLPTEPKKGCPKFEALKLENPKSESVKIPPITPEEPKP